MCLLPGGGNILIPPSDRARKLCDYLRVAIGLHFFLAIFLMVGGRYIDGVFDLLGVLIGYMAIRNPEGYSFQCVLSYCVYTGMDVFWAILRLILYFSGASSTDSGDASWQYYVYIVGLIISPFIYTFACAVAYYLYRELKRLVDEQQGQMNGDDAQAGGGYAAQSDAARSDGGEGGGANWRHNEAHPAPGGFKAFSGTGNRLGGS